AIKVRVEIVLGQQRKAVDRAPIVTRMRASYRITWHSHQRYIAGVNETGRQHGQRGLRADAVVDLLVRVQLHLELSLHEPRYRFLKGGDTVVGIATVFRTVDFFGHARPNSRRRHFVVFADAKVQQRPVGILGKSLSLGPLDLLKLIDFGSLAVTGAANPLGEERLKIRVAH